MFRVLGLRFWSLGFVLFFGLGLEFSLGLFQVGSYPYRSLIEALYTLNSPPVVSFNLGFGFRRFLVGSGSFACAGASGFNLAGKP